MKLISAKLSLPSLAVCAMAAGLSAVPTGPAQACSSEPYVGAVCTLGTNFCPQYYLPTDGRSLPIKSNAALYSLLGIRFGGDGNVNFNIPDLRGRIPVGVGVFGNTPYTLGTSFGAQTVALTQDNLPTHSHNATFTAGANGGLQANLTFQASGDVPSAGGSVPSTANPYIAANSGNGKVWAVAPQTNLASVTGLSAGLTGPLAGQVVNEPTGAGAPVSLLPPQQGVTYCIAVSGIYPPRY